MLNSKSKYRNSRQIQNLNYQNVRFITVLSLFGLFLVPNLVLAVPPAVDAACSISCTVVDVAEWSDAGSPAISPANPATRNSQISGSKRLCLYTNTDVKITADNSGWGEYDSFLREGPTIRHISGDEAVEVILSVRIPGGDSGKHGATQTITVCWKS